jgi:hypothetical protein
MQTPRFDQHPGSQPKAKPASSKTTTCRKPPGVEFIADKAAQASSDLSYRREGGG